MRSSHGGAGHVAARGVGVLSARQHRMPGREDVHAGPEVREGRPGIACLRSAGGEGRRSPGWTHGAGVRGIVRGSHGRRDASRGGTSHGLVRRSICASASAEVDDGRALLVRNSPVEGGDHVTAPAATVATEHPQGDQGNVLGHAVLLAPDRSCDMGAMAVAVCSVIVEIDEVITAARPAAEVRMAHPDAAVDDVDGHPRPCRAVAVLTVEQRAALVYAVQTPGRRGLCLRCGRSHIGCHRLDLRVGPKGGNPTRREVRRKTGENSAEPVADRRSRSALLGDGHIHVGVLQELDDVPLGIAGSF